MRPQHNFLLNRHQIVMLTRYSAGMEKANNIPQEDVTKQHYKGPSMAVAGIGEAAMQAKVLTVIGLAAGGLAAFFAPKQSEKLVDYVQKGVSSAAKSDNALKKLVGFIGDSTLSLGKHAADVLTSPKFVKKQLGQLNAKRVANVIDGSILGAAVGSFLGLFTGGTDGVYTARAGRKQFDTAKEEIVNLRDIVVEKDKEIADIKTAQDAKKGTLKVASDETHDSTLSAEAADTAIAADEANKAPAHSETIPKPKANWAGDISAQNTAKADAQLAL